MNGPSSRSVSRGSYPYTRVIHRARKVEKEEEEEEEEEEIDTRLVTKYITVSKRTSKS